MKIGKLMEVSQDRRAREREGVRERACLALAVCHVLVTLHRKHAKKAHNKKNNMNGQNFYRFISSNNVLLMTNIALCLACVTDQLGKILINRISF